MTGRRYVMIALQQTACVLSPPPPAYKFNLRFPPLRAVHGDNIADLSAATPRVLAGEAALKVYICVGVCIGVYVGICIGVCIGV